MNERAIAELFGLRRIAPGRATLRDESGSRIPDVVVEGAWRAVIAPSFYPHAQIAALQTITPRQSEKQPLVVLRGAMIVDGASGVVADLENDPLLAAVAQLNLSPRRVQNITLDGIVYTLWLRASDAEAVLTISNPVDPQWTAIESALFEVAKAIAGVGKSSQLDEYITRWSSYRRR